MSLDDIKTAIKTFNPTKASSPDAISPRMLTHLPEEFLTTSLVIHQKNGLDPSLSSFQRKVKMTILNQGHSDQYV